MTREEIGNGSEDMVIDEREPEGRDGFNADYLKVYYGIIVFTQAKFEFSRICLFMWTFCCFSLWQESFSHTQIYSNGFPMETVKLCVCVHMRA